MTIFDKCIFRYIQFSLCLFACILSILGAISMQHTKSMLHFKHTVRVCEIVNTKIIVDHKKRKEIASAMSYILLAIAKSRKRNLFHNLHNNIHFSAFPKKKHDAHKHIGQMLQTVIKIQLL